MILFSDGHVSQTRVKPESNQSQTENHMKIKTNSNVPDSTYFTTTEVEPNIEKDGSITIFNGKGTRRSSWGAPSVTSTVVLDECDFCAIHIGFHHKHRGGQSWYYYMTDGAETYRVKWQQLPDELRQRVLDNVDNAPGWAKEPGTLRSTYAKPALKTMTTYKLVKVQADRLVSLYDGVTEYVIGKRLGKAVGTEPQREMEHYGVAAAHDGGYYSHPTQEQVMRLWESGNLVPDRCKATALRLALIECEISGVIVEYANGKLASTYLKPLRVVSEFDYTPAQ